MENKSHNTKLTVITKQFLIPSWPKILLYLLVGGLLLMLWNGRKLWEQFDNSILNASSQSTNQFYVSKTSWAGHAYNSVVNGRLAQIIFWAFAGCAVYVCIWFVTNIFSNIRNDIVADEYVHPRGYNRTGYWHTVIARKVFLVAVSVVLLMAVLTGLRIMGLLAKFFYASLHDFRLTPDLAEIAGAILAAGFLVYIIVLLAHIAVNSWRAVYTDL